MPPSIELVDSFMPQLYDELVYEPEIYEQHIVDNCIYFVDSGIESTANHKLK